MRKYGKITIVGVGLIGGSIGLAIKKKRLAKEVIGVGHRASSIKKAIKKRTIDRGTLNLREGVRGTDIVILAAPVLTIPKLARKMAGSLKRGSIVTDVGSVKSYLTDQLEGVFPRGVHFVGGHPMAGSEKRGVDKAKADLFKSSLCILTKTKRTDRRALAKVKNLWEDLGAEIILLSPQTHDRFVSEISHLPHMVVFAMLNSINTGSLRFASTGFFDTTRIASSDARIWKDIAISNKREILNSIDKFKKELLLIEKSIKENDSEKLISIFSRARKKKEDYKHR